MGLEISKSYSSHSFHLMTAKLHEDTGYHGERRLLLVLFLAISEALKISLWYLEI